MSTKNVTLECIYLSGYYPKYKLNFRGGRQVVTPERFEEIKTKPEYGREFAIAGQLGNAAKTLKVEVIRQKGMREEVIEELRREAEMKAAPEEPVLVEKSNSDIFDPDEAARLLKEHEETEATLHRVAESEAQAKAAARKARTGKQ